MSQVSPCPQAMAAGSAVQTSKEDCVTFTNPAGNTPIQPAIGTALISALLHLSTLYWLEVAIQAKQ